MEKNLSKMKFCQQGKHTTEKLWWSAKPDRLSACKQCAMNVTAGKTMDILKKFNVSKESTAVVKKALLDMGANKAIGEVKKRKPINKVGAKMKERLRLYYKVRETYLDGNIGCEAKLGGCNGTATDIHHKCGRTGDLLFDMDYFLAVCRPCHNWIEENPKEAKKRGLSFDRLDK